MVPERDIVPYALVPGGEATARSLLQQNNIDPDAIDDVYPCTSLQDGLMLLSIKEPGAYITHELYELPTSINIEQFRNAWTKFIEANTIWRTRLILTEQHGILQVVFKNGIQWKASSCLQDYMDQAKNCYMGFAQPLCQFTIINDMQRNKTYFGLVAHHVIYDGWSLSRTLETVSELYHGHESSSFLNFRTFIDYLSTVDEHEEKQFWSSYLSGMEARPFPATTLQEPRPDREIEIHLDWQRRPSDYTPFTFLKAAWAVLISRYTSCEDVVFGTTLNGRNATVDDAGLIMGPTITTVPIRAYVNSSSAIVDLLERIQDDAIDMMEFEHTGLQNISRFSDDAKAACHFHSLLLVGSDTGSSKYGAGIFGTPCAVEDSTKFNSYFLLLDCNVSEDGVIVNANFDQRAIDESQVRRVLRQFEHILNRLSTSSDNTLISSLQHINSEDQEDIKGWNKSLLQDPVECCAHWLVERQVKTRPNAPAVCAWDGNMSFQELDIRSSQLAFQLIDFGVGPEIIVPLCFKKSKWAIVAMLGVLKAGGAFLFLDPDGPVDRRDYICKLIGAKLGLASKKNANFLRSTLEIIVVVQEQSPYFLSKHKEVISRCKPDNIMYVIFTSGSTGMPKGCIIEHRAYVSSALRVSKALGMEYDTRTFQFSSYTFDTAIEEILTTLVVGGCVCVPTDAERVDDLTLALNKYRVTFVDLTPSVAKLVDFKRASDLKTVVYGGEMLQTPPDYPLIRFINSYGVSEASITNTVTDSIPKDQPMNIGKGIACASWIVDSNDHNILLPIGAEGELLLEGPPLARGYLHDPEKTSQAFITGPAWAQNSALTEKIPHQRFYKTGDIVRYASDGTLIYIGRKDTQVKLRGQRIELGEVENCLRQALPSSDVAVEIIQASNDTESAYLVAFVTFPSPGLIQDAKSSITLSPEDIDSQHLAIASAETLLSTSLPQYMIPREFIPVTSIPLNTSGKTDRHKLREIYAGLSSEQISSIRRHQIVSALATSEENRMLKLWAKVLKIPENSIGLANHFFRIGGDSIIAMRLVAAARDEGLSLTVADVFKNPLLRNLARISKGLDMNRDRTGNVYKTAPIQDLTLLSSVFSFTADDIQFMSQATDFQAFCLAHSLLKSRGYMNYLVFSFNHAMDSSNIEESCHAFVNHHEILRTVFVFRKNKLYQVCLKSIRLAIDQYICKDNDIDAYCHKSIEVDKTLPLSLTDPLLAFKYFKAESKSCLIMRICHAQYDGICLPTILRDLQTALSGEPITPKEFGMSRFVHGIENCDRQSAINYWSTFLDGCSMTNLCLGSTPDRFSKSEKSAQRNISTVSLSSYGFTFATILKTAWAIVLGEMSHDEDIVFGHLVSGRTLPVDGIDQVIGPCLNIIPIRLQLRSSIIDLLQNIHDQQIAAMRYEHLGFSQMLDQCTSWPVQTRFSSIIQHQNLDESVEHLSLNGTSCSMKHITCPANAADAWVMTVPLDDGTTNVSIEYYSDALKPSLAEELVDRLCRVIRDITADPHRDVSDLMNPSPYPRIPLKVKGDRRDEHFCPEDYYDNVVQQVWNEIVLEKDEPIRSIDPNTSIFDVCNNMIIGAKFQHLYEKAGVKIDLDDILKKPTFDGHRQLVATKYRS